MAGDILVTRGTHGLQRFGGRLNDEWLRRLQGRRGLETFREMADNDDIVGAVLFAIEMLIRNVPWRVQAYSDDPKHTEQAEFIESLMTDMETTWEDVLAEILSMLPYGFAPLEIIYKRRGGLDTTDKTSRSKHTDNRIGWRDLSIRSQLTVDRWEFNEDGDWTGFWQMPVEYDAKMVNKEVFIPSEKLLLFRPTMRRGNPEGRSILRNAFVSWFYKKRIQESEAIGIERDLAGMPIFYVPPELFDPNADAPTKAMLATYKSAVENIKNDEQAGLVLPANYDENGNQLVRFELAGTGARRLIDTDAVVARHNRGIAQTVLADFILLGATSSGSYALSKDKTELFASAVSAILKAVAAVLNRQGVARLYELNGWDAAEMAEFVAGDIEKDDIASFSAAIVSLTGAGWLTPGGEEDENHLRKLLDMPEKAEDLMGEDTTPGAAGGPAGNSSQPGGAEDDPNEDEGAAEDDGEDTMPGGQKQ